MLIIVSAVSALLLCGFFYLYFGHIERKFTEAYESQQKEIVQRKRSEEKLIASNQQIQATGEQLEAVNQQLQTNEQKLRENIKQLECLNKTMEGREERVLELKAEVNDLLSELNREPTYKVTALASTDT